MAEETKKAPKRRPTKIERFKSDAPTMMKELTTDFIIQTDFKSRAKVRLKMKSTLDMLSTDTTYPKAKKEDETADAHAGGPRPRAEGRDEDEYVPEPSRMNDNILGGPDE